MRYIMLFVIMTGMLYCATAEHQETHHVEPGTVIEVYNINGDIIVSGWQENKVEINVLKKTNKESDELNKVTFEISAGEKLIVKTKYLEENPKVSVTYTIKVPAHARVGTMRTSNGKIEVAGTKGDAVLQTSNGDITVEGNEGTIKAKTSNGDILIENCDKVIEAVTSNGKIKAQLNDISDEDIRIHSSNGSINLYIASDIDARVDASTSNGKVSANGLEFIKIIKSKSSLIGTLGDGSHEIDISTSNGSINLYVTED